MQLIAQDLGGVVEAAEVREYGRATLTVVIMAISSPGWNRRSKVG